MVDRSRARPGNLARALRLLAPLWGLASAGCDGTETVCADHAPEAAYFSSCPRGDMVGVDCRRTASSCGPAGRQLRLREAIDGPGLPANSITVGLDRIIVSGPYIAAGGSVFKAEETMLSKGTGRVVVAHQNGSTGCEFPLGAQTRQSCEVAVASTGPLWVWATLFGFESKKIDPRYVAEYRVDVQWVGSSQLYLCTCSSP